ncbi:hypothetical protein [Streptomyces vinaceus]|uniref:hypothetical protein n=1 Tax=Streptomyces vinaceus TaxID=1960 RepID=UPI003678DB3C
MTLTDSCPNCLEPAIEPVAERHRGPHVVHGYRCPRCRHQWATARLIAAYRNTTRKAA